MTDPKCDSVRPPTTIVAVLRVRTGQLRLGRQYKPTLKRATEGRMRWQEPRRSTGDARSRKRLGTAVAHVWAELPKAVQVKLFAHTSTLAVALEQDESLREELARHLHDHHPRTAYKL